MKKRILACIITLAMVFTLLPTTALAVDGVSYWNPAGNGGADDNWSDHSTHADTDTADRNGHQGELFIKRQIGSDC